MKATLKGDQTTTGGPEEWYIDSGASNHFSPHRDLFKTFSTLEHPVEIETAEGTSHGIGKGTIEISAMAGDDTNIIKLNDVIYAPKLNANLLSSLTLYDRGYEIQMKPGHGIKILKNEVLVADTIRVGGTLFQLKTTGLMHAKEARTKPIDAKAQGSVAATVETRKDTYEKKLNIWQGWLGEDLDGTVEVMATPKGSMHDTIDVLRDAGSTAEIKAT
jgi:hypothetical protein